MKFRIIAGVILVVVLFACYVVAQNTGDGDQQQEQSTDQPSNFGGLGK
jgi:hypothetical protein